MTAVEKNSPPVRRFRLSLRDALFLGFCAAFLLILRMAFRWHLGISGHAMLFTIPLLLIARGCVSFPWAATCSGALAGCMAMLLGMGKGGPLILAKFVLPALCIDAAAWFWPLLFTSYLGCLLVGALAAASKFLNSAVTEWLLGVDAKIILQHALLETAGAVLFGVVGALLVPPTLKKLKARGVI